MAKWKRWNKKKVNVVNYGMTFSLVDVWLKTELFYSIAWIIILSVLSTK